MKKNNSNIYSDADNCPIRKVLDRFGDKWSILVILILSESGKIRFNALNKTIGDISQKVLTATLRKLEADGLVNREIFPEIPPRVEYELTSLGKTLVPHIQNLSKWAITNMKTIQKSRAKYKAA